MSATNSPRLGMTLTFAAWVEAGTGLALIADPALVLRLLLGVAAADIGTLLGRFLGIALLALAVACWPASPRAPGDGRGARAMIVYNLLVAIYLTYVGGTHQGGILLWPAVALHAVVGLLISWFRYGEDFRTAPRH